MKARIPKHREFIINFPDSIDQNLSLIHIFVLLECADALYGEQFQLAPGTAHGSSLAGDGGVAASGGAGAHAISATRCV